MAISDYSTHKECKHCKSVFSKRYGDSYKQWDARLFCSMSCKNKYEGAMRKVPIEERFWRHVDKRSENECWEWTGTKWRGYGHITGEMNKPPIKAYRLSYEIFNGPIPDGLLVRHKCDNPPCVNPNHLELGTHKDNAIDASMRGRLNKKSLENLKHQKKLNDVQVEEIKSIKFRSINGRGPGELMSSVAEKYGVCVDTIRKIKQNTY